jgi:hypothetical protein
VKHLLEVVQHKGQNGKGTLEYRDIHETHGLDGRPLIGLSRVDRFVEAVNLGLQYQEAEIGFRR